MKKTYMMAALAAMMLCGNGPVQAATMTNREAPVQAEDEKDNKNNKKDDKDKNGDDGSTLIIELEGHTDPLPLRGAAYPVGAGITAQGTLKVWAYTTVDYVGVTVYDALDVPVAAGCSAMASGSDMEISLPACDGGYRVEVALPDGSVLTGTFSL